MSLRHHMTNANCSSNKTPRELGYTMPPEWYKHEAIWLAWPHDPTTFTSGVEKVEETFIKIIKLIHKDECVNLFVKDDTMKKKIIGLFQKRKIDLKKIHFFEFDYADVWFRDYGPIFVMNREQKLAMVHWIFNS